MWSFTELSFKITPVPAKPVKDILSALPRKLLSEIPIDPNKPVTVSKPPPTETLAVLCSVIFIVIS